MRKQRYSLESHPLKTDKREFAAGEKGVIVCSQCQSVYYQKAWRHNKNSKFFARGEAVSGGKNQKSKLRLCPACQMIKNKTFEGQLTIVNFPAEQKEELKNLIKNFCQRAFSRDPMDRLIGVKEVAENLVATTTENQMTVKLAKKIKEVFRQNKIQLKISYSAAPGDTVYVELTIPRSASGI